MPPSDTAIDFAAIGHLESWPQAVRCLELLRSAELPPVPEQEIRSLYPFIPPRALFSFRVTSHPASTTASGTYIETFISPGELGPAFAGRNLAKVRRAAECAAGLDAKVVALGGFSSILVEGNVRRVSERCVLTTGNALTVALVVKGIERAAQRVGVALASSRLLIVGSTGDIGSACVAYFSDKVAHTVLCARARGPLRRQQAEWSARGVSCSLVTHPAEAMSSCDVIVFAASVPDPEFVLSQLRPDAIVCDVGYPKNVLAASGIEPPRWLFHGGMGLIRGGISCDSKLFRSLYAYPAANVAHGCLLEGALLALEGRYQSFSTGRGNIGVAQVEEIWALAQKHGVEPAPLFNARGLWPES